MYKIRTLLDTSEVTAIEQLNTSVLIPFDPANTDYQQFKADIQEGAELQDAEGNTMTAEDAQAFVATLP